MKTKTEKQLEREIEELEQNWDNYKDLHNEGGIIYFEGLKAKLEGYRKAKEEFIKKVEEEIDFLKTILKSNKGRDDCLIHMVKGRLDKLLSEKTGNKLK